MTAHRWWVTSLSVAVIACGGAQSSHATLGTAMPAIDPAARALAPDLAARVDRAADDALAASQNNNDDAAADHRERARLWRVALDAEVARITLDREGTATLAEVEALETARIADQQARIAIEQQIKREQAAAVARAEANRVLVEAERDEAKRRGGDPARTDVRREASRAFVDRTAAILAAAVALGADEATVASARVALDAARRKLDGSSAGITAAQTAFALAQRALGHARRSRGAPDIQERASLLEALAAQGWSVDLLDDGVVIWLTELFSGTRPELRPGASTLLSSLAAILNGHPHGPIQLQVTTTATIGKRVAQGRAQRLKAALAGVESSRIEIVSSVSVGDQPSVTRVILPAYGCSALANDAAQCSPAAATQPETQTASP